MSQPDFFLNNGATNEGYVHVPPFSPNGARYARSTPLANGAKSHVERKSETTGKGASAKTSYLVSKTLEVLGVDDTFKVSRVNLTIHLPTTAVGVNRQELVRGLLAQVVSQICETYANSQSSDGPDQVIVNDDFINMVLNGEV